jgi:hypothetical protein
VRVISLVPAYWFWFSYIDFIRFAWGALMVNQFTGPKGDPIWLNGQTVLQHYGLKDFKFHGAFLPPPSIFPAAHWPHHPGARFSP